MFVLNERVQGVAPKILESYRQIETATIGHLTDFGFLKGMQPIFRPIHFIGNAVTVKIPHLDSTAVHKSLDFVQEGDVLIIDMSGDVHRSCFGGVVAYATKVKKVSGVIIAGSINDVDEIKEINLPVFSLEVSPLTTRILGMEGEVNTPISVCGVNVSPGDVILADNDGVVVIEAEKAERLLELAWNKQDKEKEKILKEKLKNGMPLSKVKADDAINKANIR